MKQFYEENESFKTFVDAYCIKHHVTLDEGLTHKVIIYTAKLYGYRGVK